MSAKKQEEIRALQIKLETTQKALEETRKVLQTMRDLHRQSNELMGTLSL
ncbi:hypothetical protein Pmar_PMAR008276 [Perkinsus marinus ATCC 50983]|nr:hypothetical protein Pmar_PMAR008276 [Perkinsus marinus ATCC 50983]EER05167.1 hypothetical protein Pmar_PMAR008276 [Perkinsus marinus ATCC 50983]|eukprot:XP_002773351.1 hypothetical protein Pmar_PMAR008276 [Perkinsus marinus ATCC 50983]